MEFITTKETFILLASFLVSLNTLLVIWQKRRIKGAYWLVFAIIAIAVDNFCALMDVSSVNLSGRIFWSKMQYLGAGNSAVLLLMFFLNYPQKKISQSPGIIASFFFIPFLSIIAVMTNENHNYFWTGFEHISGTLNGYIFLHGPFYWIMLIFNYVCGTIVVLLILRNLIRYSGYYRKQSIAMLIASLFPFIAGLAYTFNLNPIPGLDLLSIGFSLSGLGIVFSIVFLRLFDILPVSRNLLVENLHDGVIVLDNKKRIVDINPAAKRMLSNKKLKIGDPINKADAKFHDAFNQTKYPIELQLNNSEVQNLLFIPDSLQDENENSAGSMFVLRDMTNIREVEHALHQSQERYRSLIEDVVNVSSTGICILDDNFQIIWVNQIAIEYWRSNLDALVGADIRDFMRTSYANLLENGTRVLNKMLTAFENGQYIENLEIHIPAHENNLEIWLQYCSRPINVGHFAGGRIEQFINITKQKDLQEKIKLLAITDELTGIYNRRGLFELGTHDFKRANRTGTNLSAIYVDIDRFKELNDRFGHAKGDNVLKKLVERIQS